MTHTAHPESGREVPPSSAHAFRSLSDVLAFLNNCANYEVDRRVSPAHVLNLDRIQRCVEALGRPDRAFRTIHVAGTKGKGSVSRMLAGLLQAAGMRVGLYTSPHVEDVRERIMINGTPVGDQEFVWAFNTVWDALSLKGIHLTYFEWLTAVAFCVFRAARVDYAVIEVGIGGRQDATNVVAPALCVVTNVEFDHMEVLGATLERIASEKAGIIKPKVPVLVGPMGDGPRAVILQRASELQAPVLLVGKDYEALGFVRSGYRGYFAIRAGGTVWRNVVLDCPAAFMATNAAHAVMAFDWLAQQGWVRSLDSQALPRALAAVGLPACCEVFPGTPTVIIDGAHNSMAAASLATIVRTAFEGRDRVLVVGVPRDKEVDKIIAHLADSGAKLVIFTRYPGSRATPPTDLVPLWKRRSPVATEVIEDPEAAFYRALEGAGAQGVVVVTGSIHLAGVLRPLARSLVPRLGVTRVR